MKNELTLVEYASICGDYAAILIAAHSYPGDHTAQQAAAELGELLDELHGTEEDTEE